MIVIVAVVVNRTQHQQWWRCTHFINIIITKSSPSDFNFNIITIGLQFASSTESAGLCQNLVFLVHERGETARRHNHVKMFTGRRTGNEKLGIIVCVPILVGRAFRWRVHFVVNDVVHQLQLVVAEHERHFHAARRTRSKVCKFHSFLNIFRTKCLQFSSRNRTSCCCRRCCFCCHCFGCRLCCCNCFRSCSCFRGWRRCWNADIGETGDGATWHGCLRVVHIAHLLIVWVPRIAFEQHTIAARRRHHL
mmetsp:Transcript_5586/g.9396  ORF Transcript_5586/g.9396 Transcript_5586/m.9396 type:complete len:249 (+) Transcript_5586:555-1301(+)